MSVERGRRRVAYVNARLLDPATGLDAPGALLIEDEAIADFGPSLFSDGVPQGIDVHDCGGHCLGPGLVDMRVHLADFGKDHGDAIAAVAGGITSLVCLPDLTPVIDSAAMVEFVARRARKAGLVKVFPYGAITKGLAGKELAELGLLASAGAVGFTDGANAVVNARIMRQALAYAKGFDRVIVQHPEEPELTAGGVMNEGEISTRLGLPGIPAAAEAVMIERDMRLVALTGARYHAAHVSTAAGADIIRRAKAQGLPVTADTAPPYFSLNETEVGDYRTFTKISPPLRSEDDRLAIIEALRDGTIDAIVSDHMPRHADTKRLPFDQASFGMVGLETLFPLALNLVHDHGLSFHRVLAALTCVPANILGLDAGKMVRGAPADLIVFDPDQAWVIDTEKFLSRAKNSPYDGCPVRGRVLRTLVDGRVTYVA
ncbi:MAG: dihydroorotase [Alphaproteobacteria bacterium]